MEKLSFNYPDLFSYLDFFVSLNKGRTKKDILFLSFLFRQQEKLFFPIVKYEVLFPKAFLLKAFIILFKIKQNPHKSIPIPSNPGI